MKLLDLTLPTPAENVALDEALLEAAEAGELEAPLLRLWESPHYAVVLGRSSVLEVEVNREACRAAGVSVVRRASGGGAVVAGPGCLAYAVVLPVAENLQLGAIDYAHRYVLGKLTHSLAGFAPGIARAGASDLAIPDSTGRAPLRKVSGNALRVKRRHVLYHGTLLYNFDLAQIEKLLARATREPEYRGKRGHGDFVANLSATQAQLRQALIAGWEAIQPLDEWPIARLAELVNTKYQPLAN